MRTKMPQRSPFATPYGNPDPDDGCELNSERVFYVGDKEADDVDNEGDWGIDIFEGPFSREDAEAEMASMTPAPGMALEIREDSKRAFEAQEAEAAEAEAYDRACRKAGCCID